MTASSSRASSPPPFSSSSTPIPLPRRGADHSYPICLTCALPSPAGLFKSYPPSLLLLLRCPRCGAVIDPYADGTTSDGGVSLVWMDLILIKPRAIRHQVFNKAFLLNREGVVGDGSEGPKITQVAKRFLAVALVEAYIKWLDVYAGSEVDRYDGGEQGAKFSRFERLLKLGKKALMSLALSGTSATSSMASSAGGTLSTMPTQETLLSYSVVLLATLLELATLHAVVGGLSWAWVKWKRSHQQWPILQTNTSEYGIDKTESLTPTSGTPISLRSRSNSPSPSQSPSPPFSHPHTTTLDATETSPLRPSLLDLYSPLLPSLALILSSLPTLLLNCILLLWSSTLHRQTQTQTQTADQQDQALSQGQLQSQWETMLTRHAIDTLLPLLCSTVAIGVIHLTPSIPTSPSASAAISSTTTREKRGDAPYSPTSKPPRSRPFSTSTSSPSPKIDRIIVPLIVLCGWAARVAISRSITNTSIDAYAGSPTSSSSSSSASWQWCWWWWNVG